MAQPERSAAILPLSRSAQHAKIEDAPLAPRDNPALQCRLSFLEDFTATSGNWVAFKRWFLTNTGLAGWSEEALPAALDDDALAAFLAIPPPERSTLTQAFDQLASIYEPLADAHHKVAKCAEPSNFYIGTGRW
ncbi:unnamed protein product [Lampetra fluviatilis]